jgi:hypothetical protein
VSASLVAATTSAASTPEVANHMMIAYSHATAPTTWHLLGSHEVAFLLHTAVGSTRTHARRYGCYRFLLPQKTISFRVANHFTSCTTCFTTDHDRFRSGHGRLSYLPLALRMANLLVQYGFFKCVVRGPSSRATQKQQRSHAMLTKFQ